MVLALTGVGVARRSHSSGSRTRSYSSRSYTPRIRSYSPRTHTSRIRSSSPRVHTGKTWTHYSARSGVSRIRSPRIRTARAPRARKPKSFRTPRISTVSKPGERSRAAKESFMRATGFPHGRPGWIVDHKNPIACGGADVPSNMQWQTKADAKAKDKWERIGCRGGHR